MDVAYARLMFLGAAGVGKTSFKRSLMKERWNPCIDSTIVSDVHSLRPIGREWQSLGHEVEEKWREVTEDDELNEMAELLAAVHQNISGINEFSSKVICSDRVGESGKGKEKPRGEREGKELQLLEKLKSLFYSKLKACTNIHK